VSYDVKVINNLPKFKTSAHNVLADAIKEAAKDIVIDSRNKAPFKKGALRNEAQPIVDVSPLHKKIQYTEEYSAYQEFGGDGKRVVRRYSTPGTGKHFLKNAGDKQVAKLKMTFKKHGERARA
jgi:hypothetical protein